MGIPILQRISGRPSEMYSFTKDILRKSKSIAQVTQLTSCTSRSEIQASLSDPALNHGERCQRKICKSLQPTWNQCSGSKDLSSLESGLEGVSAKAPDSEGGFQSERPKRFQCENPHTEGLSKHKWPAPAQAPASQMPNWNGPHTSSPAVPPAALWRLRPGPQVATPSIQYFTGLIVKPTKLIHHNRLIRVTR